MFKDIIIGQYVPGKSVLHRLDPKIKIVLTFVYIVMLFLIHTPVSYAAFAVMTAALVMISRINLRFFLKGLRPMLFIIIFTAVINLLLTPGTAIFSIPMFKWTFSITREGIQAAAAMFYRLIFLVTGTSLLTLTTTPLMLTDGIEKLLSPLTVIKVPAHEIAMMMTIAIRFIPTLAEETEKIQKAQTARGADFSSKNLITRVKSMIPILVPLFVSAFRRADELAAAMDARCYNGGKNRTRMHESKIGKNDIFCAIIYIAICAAVLIMQSALPTVQAMM